MTQIATKRCRQCGQVKPLNEFVRDNYGKRSEYAYSDPRAYRARCSICEITNRTEPKADRRERHKARDTRARHARRFAIPIDEMEHHYGWDLDRIEAEIVAMHQSGICPLEVGGCGEPVRHLDDIHVDILDPSEPPFWGVNSRLVCHTCNTRKGNRSLHHVQIEEAERQAIARRATRPGQLTLDLGL